MALSWNEIKDRALNFSKEWAETSKEEADAKPFLVEFFNVFGISSKRVSTFEHKVKKLDDKDGYIDLLWKGTILIEMKSRGKNLDKAYQQAIDYTHGLKQHELPKYILVSDFENVRLYDLEEDKHIEFKLNDLVNNVQHFGYILGYQKKVYKEQDPANIKAAELMGKLHDRLEEIGYTGHPLEVYLVRILFLLFAEDTTIFNKQQFQEYIEQRTADGGEFLFTDNEKQNFLVKEPNSKILFKELISAHEFLNGKKRWCLWLEDIEPSLLRSLSSVKERVENVKKIREKSSRPQLANIPNLFAQITQPKGLDFILIPRHSSENRKYIPLGFFTSNYVGADSCLIIPNGNLFHFGILMSAMHMAWVKAVCGRLKSDYRYSKDIVYNNYPWPENPNEKQIKAIETASQKVLDARLQFPNSSLADLYDPLTMPPVLVKAHNELDKAVDLAYRPQPFTSEANRMVFLFELYEKYTADLFTKEKPKKTKKTA